jgi:hypothetical protein
MGESGHAISVSRSYWKEGIIMSARSLNFILLFIICGLIIILLKATNENQNSSSNNSIIRRSDSFLVNFNRTDYNRLEKLVNRFKDGKGDNLMLIPPIIDGGYTIHDVMSDGREIRWTVDNTRDGMSADRGKTEYVCKAIDINETKAHFVFELSKCNNHEEKEKVGLVSFLKEELN